MKYYVKINNTFDLITDDDLKITKNNYKYFLIDNNLSFDLND